MEDTPTIGTIIQTVLAIVFFGYMVVLYLFDKESGTSHFWWTAAGLFVGDGASKKIGLDELFRGDSGLLRLSEKEGAINVIILVRYF